MSSLLPAFGFTADQMETDANVAAWREAVATLFEVDELAADEPGPFRADISSYAMGPALIGLSRASGQRFRRTAETIARSGVDHIILQLYLKGGYDGVAGTRPMQVRAGDICLFDLAQTLETKATAFENVTLVVPRPMFGTHLLRVDDVHGLVLPGSSVIARLLAGHLTALFEFAPRMTLDECQSVVEGTVSLLAACLRNELERGDADADHTIAASPSLMRIRQYIEAGLAREDLSANSIAAHFGLSRASLYRLFAPVGGIADYIRSRRLHRAFSISPIRAHVVRGSARSRGAGSSVPTRISRARSRQPMASRPAPRARRPCSGYSGARMEQAARLFPAGCARSRLRERIDG
ncbi:AraC family transcriptional regulator [Bradyrhizobium sp. STM 3561]|uniref:AraC-like ligand-binding domain-containing protein n=1 Tax=Bradyrhizobium sp. STM 3561 TaxID=578923 RepID=UPI00388FBBE6